MNSSKRKYLKLCAIVFKNQKGPSRERAFFVLIN